MGRSLTYGEMISLYNSENTFLTHHLLLGPRTVQALAPAMGFVLFLFLLNHLLLVFRGLTSLECHLQIAMFCPPNAYDRGCWGNWLDVMGSSKLRWLLPLASQSGTDS